MAEGLEDGLSRRERQIMDVVYRRGLASASEIREDLPDAPSDSAVRALLKILEDKGQVRRERSGVRFCLCSGEFSGDGGALSASSGVADVSSTARRRRRWSPCSTSPTRICRKTTSIGWSRPSNRLDWRGAEMSNFLAEWLLRVVLDASIKGLAVLAVAALVMVALRRASAASRHAVATLAVVALIALPIISGSLPGWNWPARNRPAPNGRAIPVFPMEMKFDTGSGVVFKNPPAPDLPTAVETRSLAKPSQSLAAWLVLAWSLGVVATLAPWLAGVWVAGRRAKRWPLVDSGDWFEALEATRRDLGLRRKVVLRTGFAGLIPATWGVVRPVVVLPIESETWSPGARLAVLRHELAHVLRGDFLTQGASRLACALYWFNPLVWLLDRRLKVEAERASDDLALIGGSRPSDYAAQLVEVMRSLRSQVRSIPGTLAMARMGSGAGSLEGRIQSILDPARDRRKFSARLSLLAIGAAMLLVAALGTVRLTPAAQVQVQAQVQVAPVVVDAASKQIKAESPWKKAGPGGVTVEVLGVGLSGGDDPWWSPDGSTRIESPRMVLFQTIPRLPGGWQDRVALSVKGGEALTHGLYQKGDISDLKGFQQVAGQPGTLEANGEAKTCTLKVGVVAGPWKTEATFDGDKTTSNSKTFPVKFARMDKNEGSTSINATDAMALGFAVRMVAIDRAGKEVQPIRWSNFEGGGQSRSQVCEFPLKPDEIREFQVRSCPWTWVEFPGLALEPRPNATPVPTKQTWRQTTSDGKMVELIGVGSDRLKSGGTWWTPEGLPLDSPSAGQPNGDHVAGPGNKMCQFVVRTLDAPDDSYFSWITKPGGGGGGGEGGFKARDGSGVLNRFDASFPVEATEATLKFGIASGPWTVFARSTGRGSSSHQEAIGGKPAIIFFSKARESGNGETSIVVTDTIELMDQSRVVAIDVEGQIHTLGEGTTSSGSNGELRQRDLVFRLPLARIARFEMQSRLVMWVEFAGIPLGPLAKGK